MGVNAFKNDFCCIERSRHRAQVQSLVIDQMFYRIKSASDFSSLILSNTAQLYCLTLENSDEMSSTGFGKSIHQGHLACSQPPRPSLLPITGSEHVQLLIVSASLYLSVTNSYELPALLLTPATLDQIFCQERWYSRELLEISKACLEHVEQFSRTKQRLPAWWQRQGAVKV